MVKIENIGYVTDLDLGFDFFCVLRLGYESREHSARVRTQLLLLVFLTYSSIHIPPSKTTYKKKRSYIIHLVRSEHVSLHL